MQDGDMKDLNDRALLYNHMAKMISSLETNADEIFEGDMKLIYEADVIEQVETGKIRSYPEKIAELREEGKLKETFKNST